MLGNAEIRKKSLFYSGLCHRLSSSAKMFARVVRYLGSVHACFKPPTALLEQKNAGGARASLANVIHLSSRGVP
jgi:hypothetical protein